MKRDLRAWQDLYTAAKTEYDSLVYAMDDRERIYKGNRELQKTVDGDKITQTPHVRNLIAEIIEAEVSSDIPMPKVTAKREEDAELASTIEDMLRNEIERMPFEYLNDMMERTVPVQGGGYFLVEWDNTKRTHTTVGEISVNTLHPKKVIPQPGVYTSVEDMDYIFVRIPQTKSYIEARYGVTIEDEDEDSPEVKGLNESPSSEMVTQILAYYRNEEGGIGLFSWVGNTELEDLDDYQARRPTKCKKCGRISDGSGKCECGGKEFEATAQDYEEIWDAPAGSNIPGAQTDMMGNLVPTEVPYYKPRIYPVILQKNTYGYGQLLGDSDVDKIRDQQNTVNRLEAKILDQICKGGSLLSLPDDATIQVDANDFRVVHPHSADKKALIDVYDLQANASQAIAHLENVYQEARQIIGITDSFQGRRDTTATSGKAKEIAASQTAGRLESRRRMKNAAYSALYEAMFKFKLAYSDEPRTVLSMDNMGATKYKTFNRYDFLRQDDAGEWYYNDDFLFSTDPTTGLASNREAMWQETRNNLSSGAFGDPTNIDTLILFWSKMKLLHYPGASDTLQYLEDKKQREAEMQMRAQQMAQAETNNMIGGLKNAL